MEWKGKETLFVIVPNVDRDVRGVIYEGGSHGFSTRCFIAARGTQRVDYARINAEKGETGASACLRIMNIYSSPRVFIFHLVRSCPFALCLFTFRHRSFDILLYLYPVA